MGVSLPGTAPGPGTLTPGLRIVDPATGYWNAQVNLRLRREVAWCWYQRMPQAPAGAALPPITDATLDSLDQVRFAHDKRQFFAADPAAAYLGEQLAQLGDAPAPAQSRWQWCAQQAGLTPAAQFVLALALSAQLDASVAPVIASCMNDLSRPFPTLALAQRLWDEPGEIIACADPAHALYATGLLGWPDDAGAGQAWQRGLEMAPGVAGQLIDPAAPWPLGLRPLTAEPARCLDAAGRVLALRLASEPEAARVVPLAGPRGADFEAWAATLGEAAGRPVATLDAALAGDATQRRAAATVCWLRGRDLLLPQALALVPRPGAEQPGFVAEPPRLALRWYLPVAAGTAEPAIPEALRTPALAIEALDFSARNALLARELGAAARKLVPAVEECARRFRFEERGVRNVARVFAGGAVKLDARALQLACANEAVVEMGNLAQRVRPRFTPDELVLPAKQAQQIADILHAMRTLTLVHYRWGTARAWNDGGLSVLFCGTPGTGKTMAAEALSAALELPMYRVDLSQVVNKYIGETEKNLRRIFDAAELSDCILFFDEADALFGKRTDVKDAHDRFANIEISYLLERMERFKGLAVLATNRRKDLDEAFTRRLRYVVEFPLPGVEERLLIWQQVFPPGVDTTALDLRFLARQFQLAGGHIRSIAFNACLRAADADEPRRAAAIGMRDVLVATRRELEKMDRAAGDELFGRYRHLLARDAA